LIIGSIETETAIFGYTASLSLILQKTYNKWIIYIYYMKMDGNIFRKELRTLGGTDMATQGFSVPKEVKKALNLEEGDELNVKIEKVEDEESESIRDKQEVMNVLRTASVTQIEEIIEMSKTNLEHVAYLPVIPKMEFEHHNEKTVTVGFLRGLGYFGLEDGSKLKEKLNEIEKRIDNHHQKSREGDDRLTDRAKHDRKIEWRTERDKLFGSLMAVKWLLGEDQPKISRIEKEGKEE
jgi:antitoxin component of MazEF toxin-antitoxin module